MLAKAGLRRRRFDIYDYVLHQSALGGGAFSPSDLSGLQLWLKADAGTYQDSAKTTPAASDGDVVGAWADQSGNGRDFTQATTGNKPTLKLNIQNGRPVIRFDGGDYLTATLGSLSLVSASAGTIFVVQMQASADAQNTTFQGNWSTTANTLSSNLSWNDGLYFDFGNASSGGRINGAQPAGWDDAYHIIELYRSAATGQINVDGASVVSASFTDNLDAAANATCGIGATPSGGTGLTGDICEMIFYNSALSTADRQRIEQYLSTRWGITLS